MHSIIIISKNKQLREDHAKSFCAQHNIDPIDITILDIEQLTKKDTKKTALSIGIEEIKKLQEKLFLKPIKSNTKACIIYDAELLTIEAQNAMLKILEEPPAHTIIILTAESKEIILPTILSRCQIISLKSELNMTPEEKTELQNTIITLKSNNVSYSMKLAEKLGKNKETAVQWLEQMIIMLRENMLAAVEQGSEEERIWYAYVIEQFQQIYITIKTTNINLRMTLEILFLSLVPQS